MRLGFAPSGRRSSSEAIWLASEAEGFGFAEVWVSEDYCERGAFAVAGAIAAVTDRVQVGIGVVNPWTRHPVLLAMEAAALAEIAEGRAVLGLGASNERWMEGQLGIPFRRPIAMTRECLVAVRDLLDGAMVQREVCGHQVNTALSFDASANPVPLVMGVKGRVALREAAQTSDGIVLSVLSSPDYIRWVTRRLGPQSPPLTAYVIVELDEDPVQARNRVRPQIARFLGVHGPHDITREGGLDQNLAAEFRRRLVAGESAGELVTDEIVDTFAIAGDTATCVAALRRFADTGVSSLVVVDSAGTGTRPADILGPLARAAQLAGLLDDSDSGRR